MIQGFGVHVSVTVTMMGMISAIRQDLSVENTMGESRDCSSIVPGSFARKGNKMVSCQCPEGMALQGPVEFCGRSGRINIFDPMSLPPLNCTCTGMRTCPRVGTVPDFNISQFARHCWFVQQQGVPEKASNKHGTHCVSSSFTVAKKNKITIRVSGRHPYGGNGLGGHETSQWCAKVADKMDPSQMTVKKCSGGRSAPLWVLAYSEEEGFAVLANGQPQTPTVNGCRHEMKDHEGISILTRLVKPPAAVIESALTILQRSGYDTARLQSVTFDDKCFGTCFDNERILR